MTEVILTDLLLDTREWQTFDCKRALIKPTDLCTNLQKTKLCTFNTL